MVEGIALGLHLLSYHAPNKPEYNNLNYGVYVRAEDYLLGAYKNTFNKVSVHLVKEVPISDNWSLMVGGATGYRYKITPLIGFNYNLQDGWGLTIIPSKNTVFHLTYEF